MDGSGHDKIPGVDSDGISDGIPCGNRVQGSDGAPGSALSRGMTDRSQWLHPKAA